MQQSAVLGASALSAWPTTDRDMAIDPLRLDRLHLSATRALAALRDRQRPDGHWCGELEGDSILQSEYILMKWILAQERAPMANGQDGWQTLGRIAQHLRGQQRSDGGWGQFPGSAVDLSGTVKAYFALKLMGDGADASHMERARKRIIDLGGAERINSFSNFYLACLGQVPWSAIPEIPPEIVWLPRWSYFHLDKVSAWTRTMILPLAIVSAMRPIRPVSSAQGIDELFVSLRERGRLSMRREVPAVWQGIFRMANAALSFSRLTGPPTRARAIADSFAWIMERASQGAPAQTAGLGAIFPPMVYIQIVFHALGIERHDARVKQAELDLDALFIESCSEGPIRIQPCFSPVWDTGIALSALADCGLRRGDASVDSATAWLLSQEVHHAGDWARGLTRAQQNQPQGCWSFEYANAWYPDSDDTAMVAMALARTGGAAANEAAVLAARRGVHWFCGMQNEDGGWAAFDRTTDRPLLEYVPFADHNAMQDPSCPDITGRVLECLSCHDYRVGNSTVDRALAYLQSKQEADGSFIGRWGVNYIYGTWQAVVGPIRCGVACTEPWIQRAGAWMKSVQKPDGSFGESANSYIEPALKGVGPSTASQTAWGAMVLQEVFGAHDPNLFRALEWLAGMQLSESDATDPTVNPDGDLAGSWCEREFTGTGFPKVFYLRYHLYRLYFPLMALGRCLEANGRPVALKTARESQQPSAPECVGA